MQTTGINFFRWQPNFLKKFLADREPNEGINDIAGGLDFKRQPIAVGERGRRVSLLCQRPQQINSAIEISFDVRSVKIGLSQVNRADGIILRGRFY